MNSTVIVWDLETVPDLRGFAAANDLVGKTDNEVREVLGNKFPKHIYHSSRVSALSSLTEKVITGRSMRSERRMSGSAPKSSSYQRSSTR